MCVAEVYNCDKTSGVGYKVVDLNNKSVYFGKFDYSPGNVLEDVSNTHLYTIEDYFKYLTGFHCFLYKKDAITALQYTEMIHGGRYKVIKLRWYNPIIFGLDRTASSAKVVVARKIIIDKD